MCRQPAFLQAVSHGLAACRPGLGRVVLIGLYNNYSISLQSADLHIFHMVITGAKMASDMLRQCMPPRPTPAQKQQPQPDASSARRGGSRGGAATDGSAGTGGAAGALPCQPGCATGWPAQRVAALLHAVGRASYCDASRLLRHGPCATQVCARWPRPLLFSKQEKNNALSLNMLIYP